MDFSREGRREGLGALLNTRRTAGGGEGENKRKSTKHDDGVFNLHVPLLRSPGAWLLTSGCVRLAKQPRQNMGVELPQRTPRQTRLLRAASRAGTRTKGSWDATKSSMLRIPGTLYGLSWCGSTMFRPHMGADQYLQLLVEAVPDYRCGVHVAPPTSVVHASKNPRLHFS